MCLLWLAGCAMRMTLLAVPPVIPLVHIELGMSETQIGLLIGLPLAMFAIAAIPGSLLIARVGARLAVALGMVIAGFAGGARGAAVDVWTLYGAAIATGFGIAIMQPGMPTLVREWLPGRIGLGTIIYSNGMVIGAVLPPVLTIPFILPLVGGSWRLDFFLWAVPAISDRRRVFSAEPEGAAPFRRLADRDRRIMVAGLEKSRWSGCSASLSAATTVRSSSPMPFWATISPATAKRICSGRRWRHLNGAQLVALVFLVLLSRRLQRRAWPFLLFGPVMLAGFLGLIFIQSSVRRHRLHRD